MTSMLTDPHMIGRHDADIATLETSGTITLGVGAASAVFTASGTKGVPAQVLVFTRD